MIRAAFKAVSEYFMLDVRPATDDYNYMLQVKTRKAGVTGSVKSYFDLASEYRASYTLADQLKFLSGGVIGYDVPMCIQKNGVVLVKCDEEFAQKMREFFSDAEVLKLCRNAKPDQQKPKQG